MRFAGLCRLIFAFCETALLAITDLLNGTSRAILKVCDWLHERSK